MAQNPQVPASAGLSSVGTWLYPPTMVGSRTSITRLATKTGCFSKEYNPCNTTLLHMKRLSLLSEIARCFSCRRRDASKAACNSNLGIVRNFIDETRAFPKKKANSILSVLLLTSLPSRKVTALSTFCDLSPHICNPILPRFLGSSFYPGTG